MCTTPQQVKSFEPLNLECIDKIVGGGGHALILDKSGNVFAVGANQKGQLGINTTRNEKTITALTELKTAIVDIACGWDSSAVTDKNAKVYVFGSNAFNQLGFAAKKTPFLNTPTPLSLPLDEKVRKVCFGLRYMCILCENNTIYIVGRWKFTENFEVVKHNDVDIYRLIIDSHLNINHIASGSNHIIFSSDSTNLTAFGDNRFDQSTNKLIDNEKIRCLRSGWTHNGILTESGIVYLYGRNTYGQLATKNVDKSDEMIRLNGINDSIDEFHLGSEHGIVVTKDRRVWTFGWNEHGNCGNGNEANV